MDPHPAPLPTLTLNTHFVHDLLDAAPPCFALGYVAIQGTISGCFAVRPATPIPTSVTQQGCRFGHRVLGMGTSAVLQFVFTMFTLQGGKPTSFSRGRNAPALAA